MDYPGRSRISQWCEGRTRKEKQTLEIKELKKQ